MSHLQRYGSYTTYNYDVRLTSAVLGRTTTTLTTPGRHWANNPGSQVSFLVDRSQPDYAELPGQPVSDAGGFVIALIYLLVLALFAVLLTVSTTRDIASRRNRLPTR